MEKDLFSITLTSTGRNWIHRFATLAGVVFLLSVLTTIVGLIDLYVRVSYFRFLYSGNSIIKAQLWVGRIYALFAYLVSPFAAYYYFKFSQANKAGISKHSNESFNYSFKFLVLSAGLSIVSFLLNFIYLAFQMYTDWILAHKIIS